MGTDTRPATERVAESLTTAPGATVAELAEHARLGTSTVGKALTVLEAAGSAVRQPGGRLAGRRQPDRWSPATAPPQRANAAKSAIRLGGGELRGLVLTELRGADEPVTPSRLARTLGRSAGAVGNALERLVGLGEAARVGERPRRYQVTRL